MHGDEKINYIKIVWVEKLIETNQINRNSKKTIFKTTTRKTKKMYRDTIKRTKFNKDEKYPMLTKDMRVTHLFPWFIFLFRWINMKNVAKCRM